MTDPRFYKKEGPFSLEKLAEIGQCEVVQGNPQLSITDVAPLDMAEATTIGVFHNFKYAQVLATTKASAIILTQDMIELAPQGKALVVSKYPYRSYALIANAFYPPKTSTCTIDPTAVIHTTAKLGDNVTIGPHAVIGEYVEIGQGVQIGALAVIGDHVKIGENTIIGPHVSVAYAIIGNSVNIKAGARVGQHGFGFFRDKGDMGGHVPVPQLGRVIIHDYVEIGSNSTIDRGSGPDTVIGMGTRIDNLVQIAHNVHLGKGCVIVAQVGISGSTKIGDYVAAGGQAGFVDHLKIGTGAQIAAQSGVMRDIEPGEVVMGSPAVPVKSHLRQVAVLKQLAEKKRKVESR